MAKKRFTREQLIEALQKLYERLGRPLIQSDTHDYTDVPGHVTYIRRFGSWREALQTAGIPLDPATWGYDREMLLTYLRDVVERLGRAPTIKELKKLEGPSAYTYASHFGSWRAALAEVGLKPHRSKSYVYGREELLDMLRALANELGHTPITPELMERDDLPHPTTFIQRLGGWNKGLEEAGLTPRYPGKGRDT
ncbi:MAG: hypothetical protein U9R15_12205 [Chloroflexota bacterium]|nr:hypothetical protein [Chloroflexota bacterium]